MKYLRQVMIILGITLVGEGLNYALPLPVPAGVYGLFLLLVLLKSGLLKLESVETVGSFLLDIMPIMFIPSSVGIIESYFQVKNILVSIVLICILSTVAVMVVTGRMTQWMIERKEGKR